MTILFKNIKLENVRLSFPNLFKTTRGFEDKQDPHYSAIFILDKDKHAKIIKEITTARDELFSELKLNKEHIDPKFLVLRDGDKTRNQSGELRKEYENSYFITAKSYKPVVVYNRDMTALTEDMNMIYGGCYVNAAISLVTVTKPIKCVTTRLKAIQYVSAGESFGDSFDASSVFDVIENSVEDLF